MQALKGRPACAFCRGLHSVTAVGNKLYLFGGAPQKGGMLNDLWVLDVASMQWTELHPEGQLPHVRCSHTAAVMGTSIVIFGGSYYRYTLMSCTFEGAVHSCLCWHPCWPSSRAQHDRLWTLGLVQVVVSMLSGCACCTFTTLCCAIGSCDSTSLVVRSGRCGTGLAILLTVSSHAQLPCDSMWTVA